MFYDEWKSSLPFIPSHWNWTNLRFIWLRSISWLSLHSPSVCFHCGWQDSWYCVPHVVMNPVYKWCTHDLQRFSSFGHIWPLSRVTSTHGTQSLHGVWWLNSNHSLALLHVVSTKHQHLWTLVIWRNTQSPYKSPRLFSLSCIMLNLFDSSVWGFVFPLFLSEILSA